MDLQAPNNSASPDNLSSMQISRLDLILQSIRFPQLQWRGNHSRSSTDQSAFHYGYASSRQGAAALAAVWLRPIA